MENCGLSFVDVYSDILVDDLPNKAPRKAHQSYNTILHFRSAVPPSRTIIMSESIELIEGDHILEPVEKAVAMYEDLLTDLRKFLVIPLHLVPSFC